MLLRRNTAHLIIAAVSLLAGAMAAFAAGYPDRPVRLIVPAAAGGGPDTVARLLGAELSKQLGQQVVIDNRPGGAFMIGMDAVAKSNPDGYTIGYGSVGPLAINRSLVSKMPYDADKDLIAVGQVGMSQCILAVTLSLPVKTANELIAYAKKNPDRLTYAASNGSISHVSAELFKIMTGTQIVHVPYKSGTQAVAEIMAGQVQVIFGNLPEVWSHVRAEKVRALAVTGRRRSPGFPDLPTLAEASVPGYEAVTWGGIVGPAGIPSPVITRLNAEINRAIATPNFKEKYGAIGNEPLGGTPEQFAAFIREETAKWAKVVKHIGAKLD
jgi:tripartite-type tricarboxylate transporter receptor subunit TctC